MATESFCEYDNDTPEAWENFIIFLEEGPHKRVDPDLKIRYASEKTMRRFVEKYSMNDRCLRTGSIMGSSL